MSKGGEGGRTAWKALGGFSGSPTKYPKKVQQFMDDLIEGVWYVEGYRAPIAPASKPEAVPAHCWDFLEIDIRSNRAAGGGLEYHVLDFYEPAPSDPEASKPAKSTMKVRADCRDWLVDLLRKPKDRLKRDFMADAMDGRFAGLTERQFRNAWGEATKAPTTHNSFHKSGPVGSS